MSCACYDAVLARGAFVSVLNPPSKGVGLAKN